MANIMDTNKEMPTMKIDKVHCPVGTLKVLERPSSDWIRCDGQILKIADYPELAEHLKNTCSKCNCFGGDGIETFGLVNLNEEGYVRHWYVAIRDTYVKELKIKSESWY